MTVVKNLVSDANIYNNPQINVDVSGNTYLSGITTMTDVVVLSELTATTLYANLDWSYIQGLNLCRVGR